MDILRLRQLLKEHLKQQNTIHDISRFLTEVFRDAVHEMLNEEMGHLAKYEVNALTDIDTIDTKHSKNVGGFSAKTSSPKEILEEEEKETRNEIIEEITDYILLLHSQRLSIRDIGDMVNEKYTLKMSTTQISNITEGLGEHITRWKEQRLEKLYLVVWIETVTFKVKVEESVINRTMSIAIGLNNKGHKKILGMWLCQDEDASFWLTVLNDLKTRGVENILVVHADKLKGLPKAMSEVYPYTKMITGLISQLRNSLKYVVWKDKKPVEADLRKIYDADDGETAWYYFEAFEENWNTKYPFITASWRNNWSNMTAFLEYPKCIRKIIYNINFLENFNLIVKYSKTKNVLSGDEDLERVVYFTLTQLSKKWTMTVKDWPVALVNFMKVFGEKRCEVNI